SERLVEGRFRTGSILSAVRQLHNIIKEALHLVSPHVQQGELPALLGRKSGERFESAEFVLVGLRMWVPVAPHDLYRAVVACQASREPHLAVRSAADDAEQLVAGDGRR